MNFILCSAQWWLDIVVVHRNQHADIPGQTFNAAREAVTGADPELAGGYGSARSSTRAVLLRQVLLINVSLDFHAAQILALLHPAFRGWILLHFAGGECGAVRRR